MQELQPYRSRDELIAALDNGGRFYNLMSKANDAVISKAELAKAAGTLSAGQNAFLFLGMMGFELSKSALESVVQMMEPDLQRQGADLAPTTLRPSEVETQGEAGRSAIVSGYPRFVEDRTQFSGFIFIPITVNNITTFNMIPMMDRFDVWEIFDDQESQQRNSVIATTRGVRFDSVRPYRFGGVLKELKFEDSTEAQHSLFLETLYYTPLMSNP